jgi:ribulose-phosphate 3-epimerase
MNPNTQIIPAILATSEDEYRSKLEKISQAPEFAGGWVQIDIVDGKFAENTTVGVDVIEKYPTELKREIHLMVDDPQQWLDQLIAIKVERIICPVEGRQLPETIEKIQAAGIAAGLSINPETEVAKIGVVAATIDAVLLLSVRPGFRGQDFLPATLDKIKDAVNFKKRGHFLIEVDGGINETNAKLVVDAGADNLVIGDHLSNGDISENLEAIWETLIP